MLFRSIFGHAITSYYEELETDNHSPLIKLEITFRVESSGKYVPFFYEIKSSLDQSEESRQINQDNEQCMKRFSLVSISHDDSESQRKVINPNKDNETSQCTICLEDFMDQTDVLVTSCDHAYHKMCIINWLEKSHMCPLCRHDLKMSAPG